MERAHSHRLDELGPPQLIPVYAFIALSQELMARGFTQTCIERLLTGRRRTVAAIFLAAARFGAMHLHYSFVPGMVAFVGSILFGVLYARHRTVIGVTVCHYFLGLVVFGPLQLVR